MYVCMYVYHLSNYVSVCMYASIRIFKKQNLDVCMYVQYMSICVFENSLKDMQVVVDVYQ